jgi:hypothetical protein
MNYSVEGAAHGVDQALDVTDLSNTLNLAGLASGITPVRGSLKQALEKCEQLVAAYLRSRNLISATSTPSDKNLRIPHTSGVFVRKFVGSLTL